MAPALPSSTRMQLSRFVLTYRDVRPGEHVLFDVITDQYVGVDDAALAALQRAPTLPPDDARREVETALEGSGLLVDSRADDDARLRAFLEAANEGIPGTMHVTLMPTLACNLACTYCFQKDHPAFNKMQSKTEASTVEWILRQVDAAASRRLLVHYFGGEPLTRKDYLLRTAEVFSAAMAARGGGFEWELTTNGIGLDAAFLTAMRAFGPGAVKVTLDGDKDTHDAARVYRSGKGTFDEIFANLVGVARSAPDVRLRLGGNFRPEQRASYERLIVRLKAERLDGLFEAIRFKPVIDTGAAAEAASTCTSCASVSREADAVKQLAEAVDASGLARTPSGHAVPVGPCELHWKNSYVIDPEGHVYKCPAVAGRPELAVAQVAKPVPERPAPLLALRPWEKCGDCPFMPVCVGGCLGGKFLQTGRTDEVFCRKEHFEVAFAADVRARYLDEFGAE